MRPTHHFLSQLKLTLFTHPQCSLCMAPKQMLKTHPVWKKYYEEIDIKQPKNSEWGAVYEFDVPVLHIEKEPDGKVVKLMHRFTEGEVGKGIEEVGGVE